MECNTSAQPNEGLGRTAHSADFLVVFGSVCRGPPVVASVIVRVRLGVAEHRQDKAHVFGFTLEAEDHTQLEAVLGRRVISTS
jgi:hypothetical protein